MKLSTAFFYRFKTQLKFLSVFVGIFSLIPLIIPIINIFRNVSYNSTSSDVVLPAFFYFLGITIFTVRIDFKFFIQNSMSRNNIFLSFFLSLISISAFLTILLSSLKFIISAFFSNQVKYTLSITELYAPNNPLLSALVLFSLFSLAGSIGLLIGTFYQRFNNWVHLMTFGIIIVSPSLIGLTLYHGGANFRNTIFMFFKTILGISKYSFNPIILMGTLLVITSIILIPSFLMNKTIEIQRVNS